ncbi:MAG: hypothetical protein ACRDY1_05755 [Acidimicrobiales bacterium]
MSDMSQGPGWWIASDGKWYPPHLHPSVRVDDVPDSSEPENASVESAAVETTPVEASPGRESGVGGVSTPDAVGTPASFLTSASPADPTPLDAGDPTPFSYSPAVPDTAPPTASWAGAGYPAPGAVDVAPDEAVSTRRRRKPMAAVVGLAVVVIVVVVAVTVFGRSESASAKVVDAVNKTLTNGTAHLTMSLSGRTQGTNETATGTGDIDFADNSMQLQMEVTADGQQVPIGAIYLGGVIYESVPGLSTVVPGKTWLSIDLSSLQKAESQSPSTQNLGNNPSVMLQILARQGNTVTSLGPSTVDGVAVNGYSVTVNESKLEAQLKGADLPSWMRRAAAELKLNDSIVKVYIDDNGVLRSLVTQSSGSSTAAGSISAVETLDFSDYGTPVSITAPPSGQVETFQQLLQAAVSSSGTSTPASS